MRGVWARAVVCLVAAWALAGCRLDAELDVVLDVDGGGDLALTFAVDDALAEEAAAAGLEPVEAIATAGAELDGWQAEVADGRRAVTLVGAFEDAEELETATRELAQALAQPELVPLEPFDVTVGDRELSVSGGASLAPTDAVADVGFERTEAVEELDRAVDYRVAVTMPGEVRTHAGGRLDGDQRVVWPVPAGEQVAVSLTGERPRPVPLAVIAALVGGAGAALLAVGVALRRR